MNLQFGPAGSPIRFKEAGYKSTLEMPNWLKGEGLQAFEYACGRGYVFGEDFAKEMGERALSAGISMSLHAPYFINLATEDDERKEKVLTYLKDAVKFAKMMNADRIVFHPGGASKGREQALFNAQNLLNCFLEWMSEEDPNQTILLGVETHGTKNQLGNLDELIALCKLDTKRMIPVIDWAHLHAVANGGYAKKDDYLLVLEAIATQLGDPLLQRLHMHFSAIEYGPSGELRHRTFAEPNYGPDREPLLQALIEMNSSGRIICECAGTQDVDALFLQNIYKSMIK